MNTYGYRKKTSIAMLKTSRSQIVSIKRKLGAYRRQTTCARSANVIPGVLIFAANHPMLHRLVQKLLKKVVFERHEGKEECFLLSSVQKEAFRKGRSAARTLLP
jgi:hypothetical protein